VSMETRPTATLIKRSERTLRCFVSRPPDKNWANKGRRIFPRLYRENIRTNYGLIRAYSYTMAAGEGFRRSVPGKLGGITSRCNDRNLTSKFRRRRERERINDDKNAFAYIAVFPSAGIAAGSSARKCTLFSFCARY